MVALSTSIDKVDGQLASFKRWQATSLAELDAQEASLEEEIDAAAFRIEDELAAAASGVPSTSSPRPAAVHQYKGLSAAVQGSSTGGARSAPASRRGTREAWAAPDNSTSAAGRTRTTGGGGAAGSCGVARSAASLGPRGQGALAPEVAEFDEFVLAHGETGGWDPQDHEEFVSILKVRWVLCFWIVGGEGGVGTAV